eukprot:scaffold79881_cov17-Tisochrysis_lutea.AAC.1
MIVTSCLPGAAAVAKEATRSLVSAEQHAQMRSNARLFVPTPFLGHSEWLIQHVVVGWGQVA